MNYNDSINFEAQLQKQIAHTLRILYTGKNLDLSDSKLIIGILDKNIYNSLLISSFASDTLAYLINNDGLNFSNVELVNYIKDNWTIIKGQEEIRVFIDKNSIQSEQKAEIKVFKQSGSLLQETYYLNSSEDIIYYIGRGIDKRENDIVIDDSHNSQYWELNKYVRSAHAHITFTISEGFLLWADKDGTPPFGSRTRIFRKGLQTPEDLPFDNVPLKLKDGDIIELGKHVKLLFKIISEN